MTPPLRWDDWTRPDTRFIPHRADAPSPHEPADPPLPPRTRPFIRRFHTEPCAHGADERCPGCPHEGRAA